MDMIAEILQLNQKTLEEGLNHQNAVHVIHFSTTLNLVESLNVDITGQKNMEDAYLLQGFCNTEDNLSV